ncbi:hypothetical protein [Streptomyces xanthii]|uniref:hypothetical protein n=1 Tax=Streptomyces xanthii TaxID=2768069 RepID=UPI001CB79911|nr:hypothetical protein [Streptomyces xanthii]
MYRRTRHTATALAAVALLTAVTSACSGSTETPRAASSTKPEAGAPDASPAQKASRPDHERLDDKARRLLDSTDGSSADGDGFIASGSLAIPGQNLDKTIASGTTLRVEVACAGNGEVTFKAVSGTARVTRRVDCAQPETTSFRLTTAAPRLAVQADSATPETVGTAYSVRRAD